ncbi:MAG: Gfo/Idh/MocA family oxidoreductase [Bacillota bacterium]|nr:Gfo/Idh/MocA family oxidoreductase [Bacillota bacterium]
MDKIELGFVGLGGRGRGLLKLLCEMEDVHIAAICDVKEDLLAQGAAIVTEKTGETARQFTDFDDLLTIDEIQGVVIATSWVSHVKLAIAAMKAGKYAAFEVGGATSLEECWRLVRTREETGVPCMMLENCCYGRTEMALLNMIRQDVFGELIHMRGAYGHNLSDSLVNRIDVNINHYRHHHYHHRNCDNYPTHALGPICNMLDINRGNRLLTLTSTASKARGLHHRALVNKGVDSPEAAWTWENGDVVSTVIKCAHGETICLTLDTCLPRPYSRQFYVQGVHGLYMEDGNQIYIENVSPKFDEWESFSPYLEKYDHPLWRWFIKAGVKGGHGGMDYLVQRAFVESIRDGRETPVDAYDAAAWMSITCLSEQSVSMGSMPVPVPDFTNGAWIDRAPDPACRYSLDQVHDALFED